MCVVLPSLCPPTPPVADSPRWRPPTTADTYQLNRLIERIISVPRLPALIIGGRPIGSYLQMMSMQYSGELYSALDDAGVKYLRPDDDDEYQTEDDDDEAVQPW